MNFDALFFDIDGTLLTESKLMPQGIQSAFAEKGFHIEVVPWRGVGMTDYQIVRLFLDDTDLSEEEKISMADEISKIIPMKVIAGLSKIKISPCPGVPELLAALKNLSVPMGLLTGNLQIITGPKLRKAGLDPDVFSFGGFGDHSPIRSETARRALQSASEFLGKPIVPQRALIIGDTPNDIACAKSVNARSLGVGTGKFSVEDLTKCGADYSMPNLTDISAFLHILGIA